MSRLGIGWLLRKCMQLEGVFGIDKICCSVYDDSES